MIKLNTHLVTSLLCTLCLIFTLSFQAAANNANTLTLLDATKIFNELFGEAMRTALATRDATDDIELANKLIETAPLTKDQPELAVLMCEKAYTLGSKTPDGYPTAIKALETLIELDKTQAESANKRILQLYQRAYITARGDDKREAGNKLLEAYLAQAKQLEQDKQYDEASSTYGRAYGIANALQDPRKDSIRQSMSNLIAVSRTEKKIEQLKERIRTNPEDLKPKEDLFQIYMVEQDSPETARKFSFLFEKIPNATERIKLITSPIEELTADQSLELATWYFETLYAGPSTDASKPKMLLRAKTYYDDFLSKYQEKDVKRIKATLALERITTELKNLEAVGRTVISSTTKDLLKMIEPDKHTLRGKYSKLDGKLVNDENARFNVIAAPVHPTGNYDLNLTFERAIGDLGLSVNLPIGEDHAVTLVVGSTRGAGMGDIDRKNWYENASNNKDVKVANGTPYKLKATMRHSGDQVKIEAYLNGKKICSWSGNASQLSQDRWSKEISTRVPGIITYRNSKYGISKFTITPISGKIEEETDLQAQSRNRRANNGLDDVDWDKIDDIRKRWQTMSPAERVRMTTLLRQMRPDDWGRIMQELRR